MCIRDRYVERRLRTTLVMCAEQTYTDSQRLNAWEEILAGQPFARCHESFIVNLGSIAEPVSYTHLDGVAHRVQAAVASGAALMLFIAVLQRHHGEDAVFLDEVSLRHLVGRGLVQVMGAKHLVHLGGGKLFVGVVGHALHRVAEVQMCIRDRVNSSPTRVPARATCAAT